MSTSPLLSTIAVKDDGEVTTFEAGDVELAKYNYRPDTVQVESPKPFFHPIRTLGGRQVSLFRPHDHVWHKGLSFSLANAGPHNFWGGPTYTRKAGWYEQLANNGSQDHVATLAASSDSGAAVFNHDLVWHAESGEEVFTERRELSASILDGDSWMLSWSTSLTNVSGEELAMGSPTTEGRENAGYGGLFWRGPREFNDGVVVAPTGAGDAEEYRSTRQDWLAYVGRHDGDGSASTLLMVDGGSNPGGQPQWFVRADPFGCMNPAPFFSEVIPMADGETLDFSYAIVFADGESDVDRAGSLATAALAVLQKVGE